jgi:hypothetical protein
MNFLNALTIHVSPTSIALQISIPMLDLTNLFNNLVNIQQPTNDWVWKNLQSLLHLIILKYFFIKLIPKH